MHYSFKSTPTISLKSRTQTVTKSNQASSRPGPTHYDVKKPLPNSGRIAQTKQKRQVFKSVEKSPGPGAYQQISYITSGPKRSMSALLSREIQKTPGPLDYNSQLLKTKLKSPIFTMGNKSKSPQKIVLDHNGYKPGPGTHDFKQNDNKGFVFGSSNRKDLTETEKTPGPDNYEPEKALYATVTNPRCRIGDEKRQLKINVVETTPGPAAYENPSFIDFNKSAKKGFSCREKVKDLIAEQLSKNPAPGHYKSQLLTFKQTAPRIATGKDKRRTFIDDIEKAKKDIPAHSNDQINFFNSSRYRSGSANSFGRSKRRSLDQNETTPGPLAYDHDKLKVLNRQPSFSGTKQKFKNEFLKVIDPQNPGPGSYDSKIDLVKQGKKSVILLTQNRPNFDKQKQKPGPGSYNLRKQMVPKFAHSKQKRQAFTDKKNEAKHGTFYNIHQQVANPPSYMKVESKIKYSPVKSQLGLSSKF